jgi:molybdopterin-containing oxidoreductase family iron-sulfur binding subunit
MDRREFIAGLPLALSLVAQSCKAPKDKIVPAINPVEYQLPGKAVEFMSAYDFYGIPYGVKISCRDGRPVKIDANPNYPLCSHGISPLIQAEIFELYNPARFTKAWLPGRKKTSSDKVLTEALERISSFTKKEIDVVLPLHSSRGLYKLTSTISGKYPQIHFHYFQGFDPESIKVTQYLYGAQGDIIPDLSQYSYILSIGSDFLFSGKSSLYFQNKFDDFKSQGGELVSIEPEYSTTGSLSDRRYSIQPNEIPDLVEYLSSKLIKYSGIYDFNNEIINSIKNRIPLDDLVNSILNNPTGTILLSAKWLDSKTQTLIAQINQVLSGNDSLLTKYRIQDYGVHGNINIINNINELSPNAGFTVICGLSKTALEYDGEFVGKIKAEDLLIISNREPEVNCFYVPSAHFLESWSDRSFADEILSIQQPVISPLIEGSISTEDFIIQLGLILGLNELDGITSNYDYIHREYNFDEKGQEWKELLRRGYNVLDNKQKLNVRKDLNIENLSISTQNKIDNSQFDILVLPDIYLFDNNRADNPWLHELPHPVSRISWKNTALISPGTAAKLNLMNGDLIKIESGEVIEIPVFIINGTAENTIIIYYGRYLFQNDKEIFITKKFGEKYFRANVSKIQGNVEIPLFQNLERNYYKELTVNSNPTLSKNRNWVLSVEPDKCIGCHSCVVSCQIENNIPYVGFREIDKGRNLHWIKVDIGSNPDEKRSERRYYFPIMCQQCANAPCEPVCPVFASTHSKEGLNETTYNRCIGSRFCMVNCPYKIRKFNYFNYSDNYDEPLNYCLNPNVTVRMRGIVEKCTFCIQRINEAKRDARFNGNELLINSVKTACQESCPTNAINLVYTGDEAIELDKDYSRLLERMNTDPSVLYKTGKSGNGRV